jgi:hypothetical protein
MRTALYVPTRLGSGAFFFDTLRLSLESIKMPTQWCRLNRNKCSSYFIGALSLWTVCFFSASRSVYFERVKNTPKTRCCRSMSPTGFADRRSFMKRKSGPNSCHALPLPWLFRRVQSTSNAHPEANAVTHGCSIAHQSGLPNCFSFLSTHRQGSLRLAERERNSQVSKSQHPRSIKKWVLA